MKLDPALDESYRLMAAEALKAYDFGVDRPSAGMSLDWTKPISGNDWTIGVYFQDRLRSPRGTLNVTTPGTFTARFSPNEVDDVRVIAAFAQEDAEKDKQKYVGKPWGVSVAFQGAALNGYGLAWGVSLNGSIDYETMYCERTAKRLAQLNDEEPDVPWNSLQKVLAREGYDLSDPAEVVDELIQVNEHFNASTDAVYEVRPPYMCVVSKGHVVAVSSIATVIATGPSAVAEAAFDKATAHAIAAGAIAVSSHAGATAEATHEGAFAKAMVEGAIAVARAEGVNANSYAKGAIAKNMHEMAVAAAYAPGAIAQACVAKSNAFAMVPGGIAEAVVADSAAIAWVSGGEAYAKHPGAAVRSNIPGGVLHPYEAPGDAGDWQYKQRDGTIFIFKEAQGVLQNQLWIASTNHDLVGLPDNVEAAERHAARLTDCANACLGMQDPAAEIAQLKVDAGKATEYLKQLSELKVTQQIMSSQGVRPENLGPK